MHYARDAFANKSNLTTIERLIPGTEKMGQRKELSDEDKRQLNLRYGCNDVKVKPTEVSKKEATTTTTKLPEKTVIFGKEISENSHGTARLHITFNSLLIYIKFDHFSIFNSLFPNAPFLYPLKTSDGFLTFSGDRERVH